MEKILNRIFEYNGLKLEDPGADKTPEQARDFFATVYPELLSADIKGPEVQGDNLIFKFMPKVGHKG